MMETKKPRDSGSGKRRMKEKVRPRGRGWVRRTNLEKGTQMGISLGKQKRTEIGTGN